MSMARAGWAGLGCAAALSGSAVGQCYQWLPVTRVAPILEGNTRAITVHDFDGPGAMEPELLYSISSPGRGHVVRWNGERYLKMKGYVAGDEVLIHDLEMHQGSLYASGRFSGVNAPISSNQCIAVFRDGLWQRVLTPTVSPLNARDVFDLASDGNKLFLTGQHMNRSFAFSYLFALNGQTWENYYPTTDNARTSAAVAFFGDQIFVGGNLRIGDSLPLEGPVIARGTFQNFQTNFDGFSCVFNSVNMRSFAVVDGQLHATGNSRVSNSAPMGSLFRWTGTEWVDAGFPTNYSGLADIHGLIEYDSTLYAYGSGCERLPALSKKVDGIWQTVPLSPFSTLESQPIFAATVYKNRLYFGTDVYPNIEEFDGTTWRNPNQPLSPTAQLTDMAVEGDDVYVCGSLSMWNGYVGPRPQTCVARLVSNVGWEPVGTLSTSDARQLLRWRGQTVVRIESSTAPFGIRIFDGTNWNDPFVSVPSMNTCTAMTIWNDNLVFVSGGIVRMYNGNTLTTLSPVSPPRAFNNNVLKFETHQGQLIAAGNFTQASRQGETPVPYHSIVVWTGSNWQNFSSSAITGGVTEVASNGPELFASGFSLQVAGVAQSNTIWWNGSSWQATSGELPSSGYRADIETIGGTTYRYLERLCRFDHQTASWILLPNARGFGSRIAGDHLGRWIHAIGIVTTYDNELEGYGLLSLGVPVFETVPQDTSVVAGQTTALSAEVIGPRPAYQWQRSGVNLVNGPTAWGSIIAGSQGPYLTISNAHPNDAGNYVCVATSTCSGPPVTTGTSATPPAMLLVDTPRICDSIDFNNDASFFDPQDIEAFLSVYSEGPCVPASSTCNDIDFNNDTSLFDPQDIASFLSVYSEGPCL